MRAHNCLGSVFGSELRQDQAEAVDDKLFGIQRQTFKKLLK